MSNVKTVVFVWSTRFCNMVTTNSDNFFGLGDIIRGTIQMYQLSKKMNFELIVDIQLHPLSKFLKKKDNLYINIVYENKDNIYFTTNAYHTILQHKSDVLYCFTNNFYS